MLRRYLKIWTHTKFISAASLIQNEIPNFRLVYGCTLYAASNSAGVL